MKMKKNRIVNVTISGYFKQFYVQIWRFIQFITNLNISILLVTVPTVSSVKNGDSQKYNFEPSFPRKCDIRIIT